MNKFHEFKSFPILSLILGIIDLSIFWLPLMGMLAIIPSLAGLIFGIMGFLSSLIRRSKIYAIIGIVLALIVLISVIPIQNMYYHNALNRLG